MNIYIGQAKITFQYLLYVSTVHGTEKMTLLNMKNIQIDVHIEKNILESENKTFNNFRFQLCKGFIDPRHIMLTSTSSR